MATRNLTERKQIWIIGVSLSCMTSIACINLLVTGSFLPLPYKQPAQLVRETPPAINRDSGGELKAIPATEQALPLPQTHPEVQHIRHAASDMPELKQEPVQSKLPAASSKQVDLTFDDGPDDKYTPKILDILKYNQVKATFFVVGSQAVKYPDIVKRIHKEGHTIGNHSWNHSNLSKLPLEKIQKEIKETDDLIEKITGTAPALVRAPFGAVSDKLKKELERTGRPLVGWNVDPRDWDGTDPSDILQLIQTRTKPGHVILLHSFGGKHGNLDNTVEALPGIITYLKEEGFRMVTVSEMNQYR